MRIESLLGATPREHPGRVALQDGRFSVTFGQLPGVVTDEASFLLATGGTRFALLCENGCEWAITDLALHHLNRMNVPLPRHFTPAQLHHVVDDAAIDTLIVDAHAGRMDEWPQFQPIARSPYTGLTILQRAPDALRVRSVPPGTVKVTYTSGSTAEPKGVCLTASAIDCVSRSLCAATQSLGIRRHMCLLPLATLLENLGGIHAPLRSGATCVLPSSSETGMSYGSLDPQRLLVALNAAQPESLILVPELLRVLVHAASAGRPLPSSLKFVAVGGAVVSPELLQEAAELGLPVFEGYGLSECASVVCLNTPGANRRGTVGRPLPHARVRLDETGQIIVSGAVMAGYLGSDATSVGSREVATGDLGEIDEDGFVSIRGRLRNIFITSFGRNVSPEWVERELVQQPGIRHALVCGEARPHAAALLSPMHPGLEDAVGDHAIARANARLPEFARVRHWAWMPECPSPTNGLLTANGRLRRERVLERYGSLLDRLFQQQAEHTYS